MSGEEESERVNMAGEIVASSLAPQLGSDRDVVQVGKTDMRRLTVIRESEIPFLLYAKLRSRKSKVWGTIYDEILNLKVGVGGRGRRDIIKMEGASKGAGISVESEIMRPGWLTRNVTGRDWERKQREEQLIRGE